MIGADTTSSAGMPGAAAIPDHALQIVSTVTSDFIEIAVVPTPVTQPGPDEVIVRIDAAPIHPSDLMVILGAANLTDVRCGGALPVGQEGAGVVIAA